MQLVGSKGNPSDAEIPNAVIEGHYRYSTRFLWPLMHGFGNLCDADEVYRNRYRSLNLVLATYLNWIEDCSPTQLHDYQHALIPQYLSMERAQSTIFFWDIAWAERFAKEFEQHIQEIARSLLRCKAVAFQTSEDMHNFARFVRDTIPEVTVSMSERLVIDGRGHTTQLLITPERTYQMPQSTAA